MKKILLLLLVLWSCNSSAQILGAPPPPPTTWPWEKIDVDNDGYSTFDIQAMIIAIRAHYLQGGNDLSGYDFQFYAYNSNFSTTTPITTPTFTTTVLNTQWLQLVLTYNGNGPLQSDYFMYFSVNNVFHSLSSIPYNGDNDNDSVINGLEDLNGNLNPRDDNTDNNGYPNFIDNDDDNDGILTINEDYNNNGSVLDDDMNANGIVDYLDVLARGTLTLNLKLFIEGYYAGSSMMRSVQFSQDGISPLTDVENITVELHNTTAPFELVTSATALLKTNGTAVCSFPTASVGSYYIAVKSSNGITTWSANPQTLNNSALTYDFSTAANKAYGNNMKNLGSGVFGLYSGDINQDESIDASDATDLTNDIENSAFGVKTTDLNGDGSVDASDLPMYDNNQTLSIFCNRP
jgi:hypothetical protein